MTDTRSIGGGLETADRRRVSVETARNGLPLAACGSNPAAAWYCVQSRPKREREVRDRLDAQGFGSFLPLVAVQRRRKVEIVPAFAGYLFARFALADRWRSICSTRGVRRLFCVDEHPVPVPPEAIELLLRLGYDRPIMAAPEIEALAAGSPVHIAAGPFAGHDGICLWSDRMRVGLLVEIMGAARTVRIPRDAVGAA